MGRDLNASTLHRLLSDDHAGMRKLIAAFLHAVHANDWPAADAVFSRLEPLIDKHIRFEERKVFPVFRDYPDQVPTDLLMKMIEQHTQITTSLRHTGIGVQLHQVREDVVQQLADIIEKHASEEDAWADAVLAEFNKSGAGPAIMGRLRTLLRDSNRT
jgi:hypothetical protein